MKAALPFLLLSGFAFGAPLQSLSAEFAKLSQSAEGRDSVAGRIFFHAPSDIHLDVRFPVEQRLFLQEKSMVIQYPQKKLAMTYGSRNPFSFPMFQALMGAMEGEGAISRSGFSLVKVDRRGDTTISQWEPRKGGHKDLPIAALKVTRAGGKLLEFRAFDRKGVLKKRVAYGDFRDTDGGALPCRIRTEEFEGKDTVVEEFALSDLRLNPPAPPEVAGWGIPADFTVKEFHW